MQVTGGVAGPHDARADEVDGRELIGLEEVGRAQVVVTHLLAGVDRGGIQADAYARCLGVVQVEVEVEVADLHAAAHGRHHHVLRTERDG